MTSLLKPRAHLAELGLSESEITVYLAMVSGIASARDLVKATRLKRPTVYYALGCLAKRGLVSKSGKDGEHRVALEPAEKLLTYAREKSHQALELEQAIAEMVPTLTTTGARSETPAVSFYEGVDAVRNVIMEMTYTRGKQIDSIVPHDNFFWQLGRDFVKRYLDERLRRRIRTRNLWELEITPQRFERYYGATSEVRILPKVMHGRFRTTIFIYDDKTLYVSSLPNCYAVLITSLEHADTMRAVFAGLWVGSKPHRMR